MKAIFVYIAVDSTFKPTPVMKITAESRAEQQEQEMMEQLKNRVKA